MKVQSVTATTAVFTGSLDMDKAMACTEFGIIYSTDSALSQDNGSRLKITSIINDNKFTETISGLPHSSEIYYSPYYCTAAGLFVVGEVKKLKTSKPVISIAVDEASVTGRSINLLVGVSGLIPADLMFLKFGVAFSDDKGTIQEGRKLEIEELAQEGKTIVPVEDLLAATTYYYCSYVEQDGNFVYGDIKEYNLPDPYAAAQKDLDASAAVNLSAPGTANCYIVSQPGLYKFKAVQGNALLAAKDASGKILWSWHIWLTDQPEGQVYYNNAGTMMDRNLGATSATPGDVGALGLLYQWGRKDPFLGSSSISIIVEAKSTITWPSTVKSDSSTGTIAYATAHPTTFITINYNNGDWQYNQDDTR